MGNAAIAKADVATTAKSVAGTATDTMVASDKPESMFGIGRPYLDKDPPHLAPIDGKEYAAHHRGTKAQQAGSDMKKGSRTKEAISASRHVNRLARLLRDRD